MIEACVLFVLVFCTICTHCVLNLSSNSRRAKNVDFIYTPIQNAQVHTTVNIGQRLHMRWYNECNAPSNRQYFVNNFTVVLVLCYFIIIIFFFFGSLLLTRFLSRFIRIRMCVSRFMIYSGKVKRRHMWSLFLYHCNYLSAQILHAKMSICWCCFWFLIVCFHIIFFECIIYNIRCMKIKTIAQNWMYEIKMEKMESIQK